MEEYLLKLKSGGPTAVKLWKEDLPAAGGYDAKAADLAALASEVLASAEPSVREAAADFFARATRESEAVMKALAGVLVKGEASVASMPADAAAAFAAFVAAVLDALPLPGALKAATKMCQLATLALDRIYACGRSASARVALPAPLLHVLKRRAAADPQLADEVLAAATKYSPVTLGALVASYPPLAPKALEAAITQYSEKVICARGPAAPAVVDSFRPLLAVLTAEDVTVRLLPLVSRGLKRAAEVAIPAVTSMLGALNRQAAPLSVFLPDLAPILMAELRHAKDERRAAASACAAAAAAAVQTVDEGRALLVPMVDSLTGKGSEPRAKTAPERIAIARGVIATAGALNREAGVAVADYASEAAGALAPLAGEEPVEEVKVAVLQAVGALLSVSLPAGRPLPSPVLDRLLSGLKDKEAGSRRAHVFLLAQCAMRSPASGVAQFAAIAAALAPVVKEGMAKAVARGDGMAAMLVGARLIAAGGEGEAAARSALSEVLGAALKADSPLLSAAAAVKMEPLEATIGAGMAGALLGSLRSDLDSKEGAAKACASLLVNLLLSEDKATARGSRGGAEIAVRDGGVQAAEILLETILEIMDAPRESPAFASPSSDANGGAVTKDMSGRFARALAPLVPAASPSGPVKCSPRLLALAALAAHHPAITTHVAADAVWKPLYQRLGEPKTDTARLAEDVSHILVGPQPSGAVLGRRLRAACLAAGAYLALSPAEYFPHVAHSVRTLLDTTDHDELTEDELLIHRAPPGKLSTEAAAELGLPVRIFDENAPQARSRFLEGVEVTPAMIQEQQALVQKTAGGAPVQKVQDVRPSVAAAGGGKGKGSGPAKMDAREEKRLLILAEEAVVRAGVEAIRDRFLRGLALVGAAVSGNPAYCRQRLDELAAVVLPLLSSPLVGEAQAVESCAALAACLPEPLGSNSSTLALALREVQMVRSARSSPLADHPAVKEGIQLLLSATHPQGHRPAPVSSAAFRFLFPLARAILALPNHTPLHDPALAFVSLHTAPGQDVPRPEMVKALTQLLSTVPASRDRVTPLLEALCRGMTEDDLAATVPHALAGQPHVRAAMFRALTHVPLMSEGMCPERDDVVTALWVGCYDVDEAAAAAARTLWVDSKAALSPNYVASLVEYLSTPHSDVRTAASKALAACLSEEKDRSNEALAYLVLHGGADESTVYTRGGCVEALGACAAELAPEDSVTGLEFLLSHALVDSADWVRAQAVDAGMSLLEAHGPHRTVGPSMLAMLERYLEPGAAKKLGLDEITFDRIREGAVVFMGTAARHVARGDGKRLRPIVGTLADALTTPSESVQRAVAKCLGPLMGELASDRAFCQATLDKLIQTLITTNKYADRMGAAFGLAGVVKGLGLSSLKAYGVMDQLRQAVESKKDPNAREGALHAFACLCDALGRLFEPYVISIVPVLLTSFGDSAAAVRDACDRTAKAIMGKLTGFGVKLILPSLLKGLKESQWRTKQGSIQLLGAMAFCAPRQLSTCLPLVVPRLSEVLTDPHPKVQEAARDSLHQVGTTIRNAEIQGLVPALMAALADPGKHATRALDQLLDTTFVNTIDAASLALVVPVVQRGIQERSGDAKRRAARIIGNMSALINDTKDLRPYVAGLLPELQIVLLDPLPDVRATAAKALGSLVHGMGQEHFDGLLPWLLERLRSESSAVERHGAAQGLAEVLAVLDSGHMETLFPEIMVGCSSRSTPMREGHLTLFKYLAIAVTDRFQVHLSEVLERVLDGLADEAESVREAALSLGRALVDLYAETHLALLLPTVENGVFAESHRIRQSSVELLGDLIYKVSGVSGKIQTGEDSDDEEELVGQTTEAQGQALVEILGVERRNEVLSRVYIARSDISLGVRSASLHVWKSVVVNTPKTLTEILPTLMTLTIEGLAQPDEERQEMAARSLGELVRKMGERVLNRIVPILQQQVYSPVPATRQGVCSGLCEVLRNLTRHQLQEHLPVLLPTVQQALCDEEADVRAAAGTALAELFKGGAGSVIEGMIPAMLRSLEGDHGPQRAAEALEGLKVILGVRPQVMNNLLPRLIGEPLESGKLKALAQLAPAAGPALSQHHLAATLPLLMRTSSDLEHRCSAEAVAALSAVALAVQEDGVPGMIADAIRSLDDSTMRPGAARLLASFCAGTACDYSEHVPILIQAIVGLFSDEDPITLAALLDAANAITNSIPKENQPSFVRSMREAVITSRDRQRRKRRPGPLVVPGFAQAKSLAPALPIYLQGLLQGSSSEVRELAADGLGDLLGVSTEEVVRPYVMQIAGPLIRILSEKLSPEIKASVLTAAGLLITKGGAGVKALVPQMQTTFLKCLSDPTSRDVRVRAADNLGLLASMVLRADQLATDLLNSAKQAIGSDEGSAEAHLRALSGALRTAGERLTPAVLLSTGAALAGSSGQVGNDDVVGPALANCLGSYLAVCPADEVPRVLRAAGPLGAAPGSGAPKDGKPRARLLAAAAAACGGRLLSLGLSADVASAAVIVARWDSTAARKASARTIRDMVLAELASKPSGHSEFLTASSAALCAVLAPDQDDGVKRQALQALRAIARARQGAVEPIYPQVVPLLCSLAQTAQGATKAHTDGTLAEVLQLGNGTAAVSALLSSGQAGSLARQVLSDSFLRKLAAKLDAEEIVSDDEDE